MRRSTYTTNKVGRITADGNATITDYVIPTSGASFTVDNATTITATTPPHSAGAVNVSVHTSAGTGSMASAYTYVVPQPTVSSVSPVSGTIVGGTAAYLYVPPPPTITAGTASSGPSIGGTTVTVTGTYLTGATVVKFGTVAATNVSVTNATSLSAKTPQHAAGSVMVSVATPGGTGHRAAAYTYTAAAGLTVKNVMVPSTDLGKFNQIVDGTTRAANAGSGGTTGVLALAPGAHVVSETAGSGTNATNYTSVIGGNCNPLGGISLATNAFKTKAPMPEALAGSAVAVLNNLLFVIAGDGSKAVHVYSPLSNQGTTLTSAPLPYNRHLLGAGVIDGLIYAVGGYAPGLNPIGTMSALDLSGTQHWSLKPSMPSPRAELGVVALNGIFYAVGGYYDNGFYNAPSDAFQAYNP